MSIDFSLGRWEQVRENYARWWEGRLERPLIHLTVTGRQPDRPEPRLRFEGFTAFYGLDVSPEDIVDRWDYDLSSLEFLGDAFPSVWPNFGPGVAAAFMGAGLYADGTTCWFLPHKVRDITELDLSYRTDSPWLRHIKEICRAAMDRWEGLVQVGMTDLGGTLDILATFRPGKNLLLDLYDHPAEVKRLTWKVHEAWWRYFYEIDAVLKPVNPGYTAWTPIFSATPYYMLQCDFSYMIGPEMFEEFVKPELQASCRRLSHPFYHLDGPGALRHLDALLSIPELRGIQWVPGEGQPDCTHWPNVYKKIRDAGKLIQIWGNMQTLDAIVEQLGSATGIIIFSTVNNAQRSSALEFLDRYGIR
ncbi:MAG: hypothetical protein N2255_06585 [Kiritimatiellae bacterium]|nr:hypothetical protein [Kiritimatiellia bacterium]